MNQVVIDTDTPIGNLAVTYEGKYVLKVEHELQRPPPARLSSNRDSFAEKIEEQLRAYFSGDLQKIFEIPFLKFPPATATTTGFRWRVWKQVLKIPPGKTRTYGKIAAALKRDPRRASQAVSQACKANRLLFIVPSHRVIAKTNPPGDFMRDPDGNIMWDRKQWKWLLDHEEKHSTT